MAKDGGAADPLRNPRFQEPSVWQLFRESLFGKPRLLDCIQVEVTSVCPGRCVYCPHTTQAGYWRSRSFWTGTDNLVLPKIIKVEIIRRVGHAQIAVIIQWFT